MRGFSYVCLAIFLATLLLVAGCAGTPKENGVDKKPVDQPGQQKPIVKIDTPQPTPNIPNVPSVTVVERFPADKEPAADPAESWDEKMFSDNDWKKIKEIYIARYIRQPEYLLWAMKQPIPGKSANLLHKGYSSFWSSSSEENPKELELGLLAVRTKNDAELEDCEAGLSSQGTGGREHLLLTYIGCWYYCLAGKNDKAKAMAKEVELIRGIEEFQIAIPQEHMAALQAEMNKASKAPAVPPKKVEPVKKEEPKKEEPKKEEPKKEDPKKEELKKEEPAKDEPKKEEPAKDENGDKPKDKTPDEEEGWDNN